MLTVNRISKTYGDHVVLRDISFTLNSGERMGLVGPNGCGKTTLLKIILGHEPAEAGSRQLAPGVRVGYLAQSLNAPLGSEATLQTYLDLNLGDPAQAEAEVEKFALALAETPERIEVQQQYEAALDRLQAISQRVDPGRIEATLEHLGLGGLPRSTPLAALSGGQKTRLALTLVVLAQPQLLLLDEPTNHLDLEMLLWLEDWLQHFRGAALIVSHDRMFLDHVVATILELEPETHSLRAYPGNYTDYLDTKAAEHERRFSAWRDQAVEIRRMKQDIARTKEQARQVERSTTPRQPGVRRLAKKVARKALSREKKLERYAESDDRVEKPKLGWQIKLEFDEAPVSGRDVLTLEAVTIGYQHALLSDIHLTLRYGERIVLVGPNGAGKTTLARTIAGQLSPLAGRVRLGAGVRLGYFAQEQEKLRPELNALTTLQAFSGQSETDLRNFLHYFLFKGDEVFTPVAELSFGERARLALAALIAQGCNFLLFDEPLNHLDLPARERFEQALTAFEGTALVITHDRYFIQRFATGVWRVEARTVKHAVETELFSQ
jgi:ATP-binding cassette subfamily F protein 3